MDLWWLRKIQKFCDDSYFLTKPNKKGEKIKIKTGPVQCKQACSQLETKTLKSHAGFDCYTIQSQSQGTATVIGFPVWTAGIKTLCCYERKLALAVFEKHMP